MLDFQYIPFYSLAIGFILDALIGDPYHWPHPIKWFGHIITLGEKILNKGEYRLIKGGVMAILCILLSYGVFYSVQLLLLNQIWGLLIFNSSFVFFGLANRTLINEGLKVVNVLNDRGVEAGRKQLSFIVGRDTSSLSPKKIRIAVLETLSENLSDGVIAPLFYFAIGGVPLMFAYKMINTLDSMIGYKSERYRQFGMIAAKIDDVVNYLPARITALLMVLVTASRRGLLFVFRYGHQHASPNAGYPESALAGILNCRFGGSNVYHGKVLNKPFIGKTDRDINRVDVVKACRINMAVSVFMFVGILVYFYFTV